MHYFLDSAISRCFFAKIFILTLSLLTASSVLAKPELSRKKTLRIGRQIGSGSFGSVRECRLETKRSLKKDFASPKQAIKTIQKEDEYEHEKSVVEELRVSRFKGMPSYFGDLHVEQEHQSGLVFKLADTDLFNYVKENKLTEKEILALGQRILAHILELHKLGFVHQDLKCENVLVKRGSLTLKKFKHLWLTDFGSAQKIGEKKSRETTPAYLLYDSASKVEPYEDFYALGTLLYFLKNGSYPIFDIDNKETLNGFAAMSFAMFFPDRFSDSEQRKNLKLNDSRLDKIILALLDPEGVKSISAKDIKKLFSNKT